MLFFLCMADLSEGSGDRPFQVAASDQPENSARNEQPEGDVGKSAAVPLEIKDIKFRSETGVGDKVFIISNRSFVPVTYALEGDRPRFVVDIRDAATVSMGEKKMIPVHGEFIERLRTNYHRDSATLRIVLDLYPKKNYKVDQVFFEQEHIYAIEVQEEGK